MAGAPGLAIFLARRHRQGKPEQGCSGYEIRSASRSRSILAPGLGNPIKAHQSPAKDQTRAPQAPRKRLCGHARRELPEDMPSLRMTASAWVPSVLVLKQSLARSEASYEAGPIRSPGLDMR